MKNDNFGCSLVIGVALVVLFLGFLLTGCTTQQKAVKYFDSHGFEAASYCASSFPIRDSTVYLPGETKVISHTDTVPGEVIPCPPQQPGQPPVSVTCPPNTHTTDSVTVHDTAFVYRENTAKSAALTQSNTILATKLETAQNKAAHRGKLMWGTWIIIALIGGGYLFLKGRTALITSIFNGIKNKV